MASRKFDFSSGSPDRPMYNTGQRGSSLAAQLNRSGSFRENMENPVLASVPSTSRSNSVIAYGDVSSFFQCLRFDPKVIAADHKSSRQGEYKRDINAALGITDDDSPPGSIRAKLPLSLLPEEIKRFRTGLRESSVKARERVKIFNEALCVFNKFFPSIPSKKRSRSGGIPGDRSTVLLSSDRSFLGPTSSKMGIQNHGTNGGLEFEPETSEERPKNAFPNKRTRTSLVDTRMDGRNNPTVKPSVSVEREREMLRVANGGLILGEDRTLPVGVDGWERSKTKKKRSGIKSDTSPRCMSASANRPAQGNREPRQGLTQRAVMEARSRSNNESNVVRPQISNGTMGLGKSDGIVQQTGPSKRPSIPRTETDNNLINDRRQSPVASEKERLGLRTINKVSGNDESNSSSPTSTAKINGSLRGTRSGSSVVPKLSPVIHKASPPSEWELSHCTGKPPPAGGANNRKRTPAIQSSSPTVAHWSGQRPQKISRTARRTNFAPIISNHEEAQSLDSVSDVAGNEIGSGLPRQFPASSQQLKLKGDSLSSVAPSESEDSGAAEIVSKEKPKKSGRIDNKSTHNVQKVSHLVLSSRKNNLPVGEDLGDGVRRQGRTGRGYASTRALKPMSIEKIGNVGPTKQLRSGKFGLNKAESKAGRPPTRKLSDRKSYARQKHMGNTAAVLFGSDDGHGDLVAAVNAVINSAHAFSSSFWRQMEPYLGSITDRDVTFLKKQVEWDSSKQILMSIPSIAVPSGCNLTDPERNRGDAAENLSFDFFPKHLVLDDRNTDMVPLYQRLLAALICEEDHVVGNEDRNTDICGTGFQLEVESGSKCLSDVANLLSAGDNVNGYWSTRRPEHDEPEIYRGYRSTKKTGHVNSQIDMLESAVNSNDDHSVNTMSPDSTFLPGTVSTDFQYESVNINKNLLLEAQSIGLFLDPMPDVFEMEDDRIFEDIVKLEEQHREQVYKKKGLLSKVLKPVLVTREIQEKEFEKHALDALVALVYKKYLAYWGPNATSGKSSSSKMFKQAALSIVKRTLERCHEFEDTGSSCFSEPLFRNMFSSSFFQSEEALIDNESAEPNNSVKVRVSASTGTQATASSTSLLSQSGGVEINSFDLIQPENQLSDSIGKEDASFGRVKKKELLLDDVIGAPFGTSNSHSGMGPMGSPFSSSTKGKRSDRDRELKGHGREALPRKPTNKIGRPVSNAKGERKLKTKPKQKMTQLSVSVNGLISEQPKPTASVPKSTHMTVKNSSKEKDEFGFDILDDSAVDLQLRGEDIGSWLNIDDDGLQDEDFMGLEIPMDDLSDLKMV